MLAAEALDNGVIATAPVEARRPRPVTDPYESTSSVVSKLVLPGPKMRVQTAIQVGERRYSLRGVFVIEFREGEEGFVLAAHRSLPVSGFGATHQEAISSFCEGFDFQWRNLVEVDPDSLTEGGKARRETMKAVVASVVDIAAK